MGTSADGRIVAAVVSDGAGTASQADIGATTTCRLMLPQMLQTLSEVPDSEPLVLPNQAQLEAMLAQMTHGEATQI